MAESTLIAVFCGIAGLVCGAFGAWIWHKKALKTLESAHNEKIQNQILENQSLSVALAESKGIITSLESAFTQRFADLEKGFETRLAEQKVHSQDMLHRLQEQYTLTQEEIQKNEERSKQELSNAFKALGAEILSQNTQNFKQEQSLSLQPLKDEIMRFTKQLNDNHTSALTQHTALQTQIEQLSKLNMQLSTDAHNLTNALKGENKTQGNWGEVILQRVFENSGLQEGREYELQVDMRDNNNDKLRPDAIVKLPKSGDEQRCVVVDAKTSLIAYERLCNAQDKQERVLAQKDLADSIKSHFKGLSSKNYQQYTQGQKLDFVLMFIPIEGAFLEAMQYNPMLYDEAYQKGVVLVSPTTIMAVLKIICNLWEIEHRNKYADAIFDEIKTLFDRIEKFYNELERLGGNIDTMKKTYDGVMTKYNGKQGIAKPSKNIRNLLRGAETRNLADSINTNYALGNDNEV